MFDFLQPHGLKHARLPCPSPTPQLAQTHVHWVGDAIQPFHPLSSPSPAAFNLSQHQSLFQGVSSLHQLAKVLEFQLQHQSFQNSGLISFRMDWLDLFEVQGTLKSLLQHHSSRASILQCSAFFILFLSYLTALLFTYLALLFLFNCFSYFSAFLHLFSSLVIACACSLELREGLGGKSLFKKQEMGTRRGFCTLKSSSGSFAFMPVSGFLFLFTHLKHWAPTLCSKITICPNIFMSTSKYFLYLFIHSLNILSIHHMY